MIRRKNTQETVIFLGSSGFPYGSAVIQRQIQLGKSLKEVNYNIVIICTRGVHSLRIIKREGITIHNYYQGIEYFYTSLLAHRPSNFLIRNLLKLLGHLLEILVIVFYRFFKNAKFIFNSSIKIEDLKYYYIISKILKMILIYDYVEMVDSLKKRDKLELNDLVRIFDHEFYKYVDKLIVISSFLEEYIDKIAPSTPKIKIPPIIDFSYIDSINSKISPIPFFIFCGSAAYNDIIKFIIEAFIHSNAIEKNYELKLVVNGTFEQLNIINNYIKEKRVDTSIEIMSKLSYYDLISFYKSARALLIPISNNLQDQARFPYKICEYSASGRPIITSDSGSVIEFFEDKKTAFIAKTGDISDFSSNINLVISQPELANKVGYNGYLLGKKSFNYKTYSKDLENFVQN